MEKPQLNIRKGIYKAVRSCGYQGSMQVRREMAGLIGGERAARQLRNKIVVKRINRAGLDFMQRHRPAQGSLRRSARSTNKVNLRGA